MAIFVFIATLLGLAFLAWLVRRQWKQLQLAQKLDREGQIDQALVIDRWTKEDSDGDKTYYLAYQFGEGLTAQQKVKQSIYQRFRVGQELKVRFLAQEPAVSRLEWD